MNEEFNRMKTITESKCNDSMGTQAYKLPSRSITLTALIVTAGGIDTLRLADSCGFMDDLGIGTGAAAQEFALTGKITATTLRNYVFVYQVRVDKITYQCIEDDAQLDNKIEFIAASLDGRTKTVALFDVAPDKTNMQFKDGLQTVIPNNDAYLTAASAIILPVNAVAFNKTVTLTLSIGALIPYGCKGNNA